MIDQFAQTPFTIIGSAGNGFFYPPVNVYIVFFTKLNNLKALILNRLFVTGHANITVNHFLCKDTVFF